MRKQVARIFILFFTIIGLSILLNGTVHAQSESSTPIQTSPSNATASLSSAPAPTRIFTNPFAFTPLPAVNGPENDIVETQPLTASRPAAQVDDSIIFSVTIQNHASYNKDIQTLCFESTDGNFGCAWGINLAPGQTYTIQNVGTWTTGGVKDVWITWSQDGINFYQPLHATHAQVSILG